MVNAAAVEVTANKTTQAETEPHQPTRRGRHRENVGEENGNGLMRYFMAKAGSNGGIPAFEKELGTEGEALVEALRQGATSYAVQEFRTIADLSGRRPQLTKEPVQAKKS